MPSLRTSRAFAVVGTLVLGGCAAASSAPTSTATQTPPSAGMARVTVTRSNAPYSLLAPVAIDLNGTRIASLGIGESYSTSIAPGEAIVAASVWSSPGRYSVKFTAEPGKDYAFLVSPRGEQLVAGMAGGMIGVAIDTAVNENSGPFKITPAGR
jgi:hypothetical protein